MTATKYQTMTEIMEELKPSNEVMRKWLWRHRACLTGPEHDALTTCRIHVSDGKAKEQIQAIMKEEANDAAQS